MIKIIRSFLTILIFFTANNILADLEVKNLRANPTFGKSRNSAAYFDITNNGVEDDYLLSANCELANKTEMHQTIENNGILKMVPVDRIAIPQNLTISFKPKSLHIMLLNLKQPLIAGEKIRLMLEFANAGKKEFIVEIKKSTSCGCCKK